MNATHDRRRLLARLATVMLAVVLVGMSAVTALAGGTQQTTLRVGGMVCSGCEATVEAVLSDLDGVHEVHADRTTETATVVHDPTTVDAAAMAQAINTNTYYNASLADPDPTTDPPAERASEPTSEASPELATAARGGPTSSTLTRVAAGLFALSVISAAVWTVRRRREAPEDA